MSQFYVTLPSNTNGFGTNTTAEYRVNLARTVELNGEWEVGLVSAQYPFTWHNLVGQSIFVYFMGVKSPIVARVPDGNFNSIAELLRTLNYSYIECVRKSAPDLKNMTIWNTDSAMSALSIIYSEPLKKIEIVIDTRLIRFIKLGDHLKYTLGLSNNVISNSYNVAKYSPDITGGFSSLYVYTDIIKPQIVGDVEASILRIIPCQGVFGQNVVHDYTNIHYVDVLTKRFDSISVSIKDDTFTPIAFQYGKVILKLHFRKKRFL